LCHVALQVLLSSTSQIDKAYTYRFVWPWLGSGLLTGTGKVIEKHAATVSTAIEHHSATVSTVMEQHSASVGKIFEHNMRLLVR
jgi:hypothetical protein